MADFIDITPEHLRCVPASCPSVHRSEDGSKYRITGALVDAGSVAEERGWEATVEIAAGMLEGALGTQPVTDSSGDPFADLGMNKEEVLTAMVQKRDAVIADLRQQITALLKAQAEAAEEAYQRGYDAGRKAAGEL